MGIFVRNLSGIICKNISDYFFRNSPTDFLRTNYAGFILVALDGLAGAACVHPVGHLHLFSSGAACVHPASFPTRRRPKILKYVFACGLLRRLVHPVHAHVALSFAEDPLPGLAPSSRSTQL